jgi:surfactin synthase thioesterase subunit
MTKLLVCLPFAGAGASFYRSWLGLSDVFDVIAAQLPGREGRLDEPPHRSVDATVADLLPDIVDAAHPNRRVVLFGHCTGAALAYELARALQAVDGIEVEHLVVSGSGWPAAPLHPPIAMLPDEAFMERVADYTGYRHVALNNPEMRPDPAGAARGCRNARELRAGFR